MSETSPAHQPRTLGAMYAVAAHILWGFLPLYFVLLAPTGPWEVVAWRVLFSLVLCGILLLVTRAWRPLWVVMRQPRLVLLSILAGALIYINWQAFLIGTLSGHVVEASLGYFINPITTVLLGVFVLRERVRMLQWVAIGFAALAVSIIVIVYGTVPWIAIALTLSFGFYGLVKKKLGPQVDALSGMTLESLWLVPVAVVQLIVVASTTGIVFGTAGPLNMLLLALAGVVTAVPLLLFAAGTRRITLTLAGIIQFITPILQFVIGVAILHEPMPIERWVGFGIVWIAVTIFAVDLAIAGRRQRRRY